MFELSLSKTPNKEASPTRARQHPPPPPQTSFPFFFFFLFSGTFFFLLKGKKNYFAGFCSERAGRRGCSLFVFARAWRNSPQTPLPPRPRGDDSFFRRNLRLYFAKQNAPPKEMLPLTHPTHSRATLRNSPKIHLQF